jgi:hypothetical protein
MATFLIEYFKFRPANKEEIDEYNKITQNTPQMPSNAPQASQTKEIQKDNKISDDKKTMLIAYAKDLVIGLKIEKEDIREWWNNFYQMAKQLYENDQIPSIEEELFGESKEETNKESKKKEDSPF